MWKTEENYTLIPPEEFWDKTCYLFVTGSGRDWSEKRTQRTQDSHWPESRESSNYVASTENLYSSSSSSRKQTPVNTDYSAIQHGNYAQELLKQSQNTKYLLSHGKLQRTCTVVVPPPVNKPLSTSTTQQYNMATMPRSC